MTPLEVRGDGVAAKVELDADAITPLAPPPVLPDVSRLPGASVVGLASHARADRRVVLGCVRAPSDKWVPGLESVVFERATAMILGAASLHPALERGPSLDAGASFAEQHRGSEGARDVAVATAIAFVGPGADAVACSVACAAPREGSSCSAIASSLALSGDLRPVPAPGLVARAVLGTAEHPVAAFAIAGGAAITVVALLLATRPKLRPTARRRGR